jgi:hypothetical protein
MKLVPKRQNDDCRKTYYFSTQGITALARAALSATDMA